MLLKKKKLTSNKNKVEILFLYILCIFLWNYWWKFKKCEKTYIIRNHKYVVKIACVDHVWKLHLALFWMVKSIEPNGLHFR